LALAVEGQKTPCATKHSNASIIMMVKERDRFMFSSFCYNHSTRDSLNKIPVTYNPPLLSLYQNSFNGSMVSREKINKSKLPLM